MFLAAAFIQHELWSLALPHAETAPGMVTVSLGVSSLMSSMQHAADYLLRQADAALYRAKKLECNCAVHSRTIKEEEKSVFSAIPSRA